MGLFLVCEDKANIDLPDRYEQILLWSAFDESGGISSVPKAVDGNFESLRQQYLSWLESVGNTVIRGRRLVEYLCIRKEFSMWWMSLLVEKSQWKSSSLYDVFRLMAFDGLMREFDLNHQDRIEISIADRDVRKALILWCENSGIRYDVRSNTKRQNITLNYLYGLLPYTLQGVIYFIYYICSRWAVTDSSSRYSGPERGPQFSFFSYFFNCDLAELEEGRFKSRYWTSLYDLLVSNKVRHNWLHLFVKSKEIRRPQEASLLVNKLDSVSAECESHLLLDRRIILSDFISIVRDYIKVWIAAVRVRAIGRDGFNIDGTAISLWPLLAHDWNDSFFGKTAITNALYFNQFETAISKLPHQTMGFYLMESQAWERALIYVWRQAGHGPLVGVQHSTVNACDLRYFFAPSEYQSQHSCVLPIPDMIAVNGDASRAQFLNGGFPEGRLVDVEALRYLYLGAVTPRPVATDGAKRIRLLVLGDYSSAVTHKQMRLLSCAAEKLSSSVDLLVKCHPACPIEASAWPSLSLTLLDGSLDQLVDSYDVAFTSNVTAAAVDVYLAGKRVISMLDPETFNMSPLRGYSGVEFVTTHEELIDCLFSKHNVESAAGDVNIERFFYTDSTLPRWTKLLDYGPVN